MSLFTLIVLIGAGVTADAESLAFFEGDELTLLLALMGKRIPVEVGSDIVALKADDLCASRDAKGRHLRKLLNARMSLLYIYILQAGPRMPI